MAAPKNNIFNPNGRPLKPVDWEEFEKLCALQCTQDEMAGFLHICGQTLSDRVKEHYGEDYSTIYKRFSESGKCSLRRNQFVLSKKNASMAIWLGKQWLDQKENAIENQASEELNQKFLEVMNQIVSLQSSHKDFNRSSIDPGFLQSSSSQADNS